jgi:hypothetical protein
MTELVRPSQPASEALTQALCSSCEGISLSALIQPHGYRHVQDGLELFRGAKTCAFCSLICLAIDQDTIRERPRTEDEMREIFLPEPIVLHGVGNWDMSNLESDLESESRPAEIPNPPMLTGIRVHISTDIGLDIVPLSLFADAGISLGKT